MKYRKKPVVIEERPRYFAYCSNHPCPYGEAVEVKDGIMGTAYTECGEPVFIRPLCEGCRKDLAEAEADNL